MAGLLDDQQGDIGMEELVAVVRLPNGLTQQVKIEAGDSGRARQMLEAQYGRGCVLTLDRPKVGRMAHNALSPRRRRGQSY